MNRQRLSAALRRRPWWRPVALSATAVAAIAALFNPVPAFADPVAPGGIPAAVPDTGSRPAFPGAITLPGQQAPGGSSTPSTVTPVTSTLPTDPVLKKVETGRAELATLGEQLAKLQEDVTLAQAQLATADQKVTEGRTAVAGAQKEVVEAAKSSVRDAAALPPGTIGSGLQDLDALARIQRGDAATQEAASRQLGIAQAGLDAALAEQQAITARLAQLTADQTTQQATLDTKTTAQQKFEQDNQAKIQAADAAEAVQDAAIGENILAGENAGRGADPRALAALNIALAQRGDPYVWSEEGPNQFDCSGLMYYSYRSASAGNFPLVRVSRDQYYQTRGKTVDRYSLLPGDLLFFSYTSSWTGIHHVAMYAGNGMMVEAPRTGLDVRLTPVRWTRMFAATRIYGSVEGVVEGPTLGAPDPETPSDHSPTATPSPTRPSPSPTKPSPTPSKPGKPTTPPTKPGTPPTKPSTPPSDPSTPPTKPSTPPSDPSTPPTKPSTPPTTPSTPPSEPPSSEPTTPATTPPATTPPATTAPPVSEPTPEETTKAPAESTSAPASETTKAPTESAASSASAEVSASAAESAEAKQSG